MPKLDLRRPLRLVTRESLTWVGLLLLSVFIFGWRLGTLSKGFSLQEVLARESSRSLSVIVHDPINLPHKLLQYILQQLGHYGHLAMRLPSLVFAVIAMASLYVLLRYLFSRRLAIMAAIIFIGMSPVIIAAHSATPAIMYIASPLLLAAAALALYSAKRSITGCTILAIALICAILTPGFIWILAIGVLINIKKIYIRATRLTKLELLIIFVAPILALDLLGFAIVQDHHILKEWLLLPTQFMTLPESGSAIAWGGLGLVLHTRDIQTLGLYRLPILDAFCTVLAVFGILYLFRTFRKGSGIAILGSIAIVCVLSGINRDPTILLLAIPMLMMLLAGGLATLVNSWFKVFPFNPVARVIALSSIILIICLHVLYGVNYSLIAWPKSAPAKQTYMIQ